jgi:hypothetical protein
VLPALLFAAAAIASPAATCPGTTVHYGATRVGLPWIKAGAVTGHLFAYGGRTLMDGRVNGSDGLVLYTGGGSADAAMKVLWSARGRPSSWLVLSGRRLDGVGVFRQRFRANRAGDFPSIVKIPDVGCWRLSLRAGRMRAAVVVRAVEPPAETACEPTPVFRHTPHPRFGDVTWMPAMPRTTGVAAVGFVSVLPGAERAVIYAGGRAPEGWNTKFLWWSPKPGGRLELVGRRMDAAGRFAQSESPAWNDEMGTIFPSIVEIPTAGCWAITVSTGGRTGLVIFEAVAPR